MQITPQVKQVVSSLPLAALQKKVVMGFDQCFYSKDYKNNLQNPKSTDSEVFIL